MLTIEHLVIITIPVRQLINVITPIVLEVVVLLVTIKWNFACARLLERLKLLS